MNSPVNPFVTVGYKGPQYFCDRSNERQQLTELMLNGINITLFAIRRLGKTGLIQHVFYPYRNSRKVACIYLDILATGNLADFTNQLATAIYNRFPPTKAMGKKIIDLFQRFRPVISFDELTGAPSLSLTLETQAQKEKTIGHILSFLDRQDIKVVIAIDEFQQILTYPEKNTEAILRTQMQQLQNISFIFCGSNQKMMHEIFNAAKRPFYASCTNITLQPIPEKEYRSFIRKKFQEHKKQITDECLDFICSWTELHTFYVQQLCFTLFARNQTENNLEEVRQAALTVLKLNESNFYQYKNLLTRAQWNLLSAIAREGKVTKPQSGKFINTYGLGTPAVVKRGLDALIKKELIFHNTGVETPYFELYDKYLRQWIRSLT